MILSAGEYADLQVQLVCLYRIGVSMQFPQVFKRLQERRPRTFLFRRPPSEKPGAQDGQDKLKPPEHAVGGVETKADARLLSGGLDRAPLEDLPQKIPRLLRAETIAKQAISGAQTPGTPASAELRAATDAPSPFAVGAPIIDISVNEPMPSERTACTARRTAHRRQPVKKSINLIPAFKETFHCPIINRRDFPLNRKRG